VSFEQILTTELRRWELELPFVLQQQLACFANEMEHWNRAINLTALRGEALVRRLIVEPIWVGRELAMSGTLMDVGSGNGSPGIPLTVTRQFKNSFLVEPRAKRAAFLRHLVAKMSLRNVEVVKDRVENLAQGRVKADWITLQAIDPNRDMLESLHRSSSSTTQVVWITSRQSRPVPQARVLRPPDSSSRIWVFGLDQS